MQSQVGGRHILKVFGDWQHTERQRHALIAWQSTVLFPVFERKCEYLAILNKKNCPDCLHQMNNNNNNIYNIFYTYFIFSMMTGDLPPQALLTARHCVRPFVK